MRRAPVRPFWDSDELIGTSEKNDREQIHVRLVEKDERKYVDVRVFYLGRDGALKPGKGIALPIINAPAVAELIQRAAESSKRHG